MTYFVYMCHHPDAGQSAHDVYTRWGRQEPITYIEFCKDRKDGARRRDQLIKRHPDLLPQDGWDARVLHYALDIDDNTEIERIKTEIRTRLATKSLDRNGERRLWHDVPGAPAGCYRLDKYEANSILKDALQRSGAYRKAA